jgi:hypothetical protein
LWSGSGSTKKKLNYYKGIACYLTKDPMEATSKFGVINDVKGVGSVSVYIDGMALASAPCLS